jgi:hypothetical protein
MSEPLRVEAVVVPHLNGRPNGCQLRFADGSIVSLANVSEISEAISWRPGFQTRITLGVPVEKTYETEPESPS